MKRKGSILLALAAVGAALVLMSRTGAASENQPEITVLKIGLVQSLFRNTSAEKILSQAQPLGEIMAAQSGVRLRFSAVGDHEELAKQLQQGDIHLAVMHGVELSWVQKNTKDLQPLVLAINQTIRLKSYVLCRAEDPARLLADLKGKRLAMPARSLYHNYLYLQKALETAGLNPAGYFEEKSTLSVYGALDSVIDGNADVAVVDGVAWENFCENKNGRSKKLKVVTESTIFPTAALVYKPGTMPEKQEKQLKEALTGLHKKPVGRQMLLLWRLSQFSDVPEEYTELLQEVVKEYPQPPKPVDFCTSSK
jgi:ABC-type phosphate/phosphonate transport system substrate-binding protein